MGLWKKIKEAEKALDLNKGKYKFNKWVFNIMVIVMLLLVLMVWAEYDFEDISKPHIYLACESPNSVCENDFYDLCNPNSYEFVGVQDICSDLEPELYADEFLYQGESRGYKPSWLANNVSNLFILLLMLALLINHLCFNKGYKFNKKMLEMNEDE